MAMQTAMNPGRIRDRLIAEAGVVVSGCDGILCGHDYGRSGQTANGRFCTLQVRSRSEVGFRAIRE